LLLRRAKTNPDERRFEPIDFIHYVDFLLLREIAMPAARDFDLRIQRTKHRFQPRQALLGSAEEIMCERVRTCQHAVPHERRPVNTIPQACTLTVQAPDQRHPVRNKKIESLGGFPKAWVTAAHGNDLRVCEIHRHGVACLSQLVATRRQTRVSCALQRRAKHAQPLFTQGQLLV